MLRLLLIVLFPFIVFAAEPIKSVSLISDVESFEPGKPFRIGVLFEIDPEWHIYWKYPGNFGLPTVFKDQLPEGVELKGFYYPKPETFMQAQDIVGYGYSDKVLFVADVHTPASYKKDLKINISTSWLSCGLGQCIPGRKKLKLILSSSDSEALSNQQIFSRHLKQIPAINHIENSPYVLDRFALEGNQLKIFLQWQKEPGSFSVYPGFEKKFKVLDVNTKQSGLTTEITYTLDPKPSMQDLKNLELIIVNKEVPYQSFFTQKEF